MKKAYWRFYLLAFIFVIGAPIFAQEQKKQEAEKLAEAGNEDQKPKESLLIRELADGEAPEIYVVQQGDTLFDICDQLLDEGEYWPKLWSLNPFIKNPHFIWPGMRLRFFPGSQEAPPSLQIVEEPDLIPVNKNNISIDDIIRQTIGLEQRVTKKITPPIIGLDDLIAKDELFMVVGNIYSSNQVQMVVPGFIFKEEKEPLCSVISGTSGESTVMEGMSFVCEPSGKQLTFSEPLSVLRFAEEIEDPISSDFVGYRYEFVATIKLEQVLEEDAVVLGHVVTSRLGVEEGDIIVPYLPTRRMVALDKQKGRKAAIQGQIVAFAEEGLEFGGEGSLVILNKGTSSGFNPGEVFQVDQFMHSLVFNQILSDYPNKTLPVGTVRIIDATDVGSVGYISENNKEVSIGDTVGL